MGIRNRDVGWSAVCFKGIKGHSVLLVCVKLLLVELRRKWQEVLLSESPLWNASPLCIMFPVKFRILESSWYLWRSVNTMLPLILTSIWAKCRLLNLHSIISWNICVMNDFTLLIFPLTLYLGHWSLLKYLNWNTYLNFKTKTRNRFSWA